MSWLKFHCISSKIFQDNSKLRLSQNSIAPHWNYSKTIPKFVLAEIQLHLVEIILWQFQINSWPKFHCISSKIFKDNSKLRLSQNSIASHRNWSNTITNCVLAKISLHLIEIIIKFFQIVSLLKFKCTSSTFF